MTDALPLVERLRGLIGLVLIIAIGVIFSRNRRQIPWTVVAWGLALQVLFAIFVLRIPAGQQLFRKLGDIVTTILNYSYQGSQFVFGEIGKQHSSIGVVFAFQILPAIIFVSALFAIMYYLGIMQVIVRAFAVVMAKLMKTSGAESLDVAASIFMGQTEAPLTIRPFLSKMTRSELMTVMTAGMAHISGSIMVAYIAFGVDAKHLLTAVIMTAPGTIMMAKIFEPEDGHPETYGNVKLDIPKTGREPGGGGGTRHQRGAAAHAQRHRHAHLVRGARGPGERHLRRRAWLAAMVAPEPAGGARVDRPPHRLGHGRELG